MSDARSTPPPSASVMPENAPPEALGCRGAPELLSLDGLPVAAQPGAKMENNRWSALWSESASLSPLALAGLPPRQLSNAENIATVSWGRVPPALWHTCTHWAPGGALRLVRRGGVSWLRVIIILFLFKKIDRQLAPPVHLNSVLGWSICSEPVEGSLGGIFCAGGMGRADLAAPCEGTAAVRRRGHGRTDPAGTPLFARRMRALRWPIRKRGAARVLDRAPGRRSCPVWASPRRFAKT